MQEQTLEWIKLAIIWSPPILTLLCFYVHKLIKTSTWRAIHFTTEFTTILYIVSVAILVKMLFNLSIIGYIIIYFLILLAVIIFMQWKMETDILFGRAVKLLLRINFLIFVIAYIILIFLYLYLHFIK